MDSIKYSQAAGWVAVVMTLDELFPDRGWWVNGRTLQEAACRTIRNLHANQTPPADHCGPTGGATNG